MRDEVPAFKNTRLAHLIRMIQLASWNRVLTYRDKALIPVAACPAAAKEFIQRHCVDPKGEKAAATAAAIAHLLKVMRRIVNPEPLGIFLAQLKDLVRWTTHERLDAGVYGHPKLQDLLLSDPFSRFYRLYTPEGNDHCTYVQSKQYLLPKGAVIHRKAAVTWRPRDCPMGGSDAPLADSRVWEFKALVPIGNSQDAEPGVSVFDAWQQQQHQKKQQQQQQQQQPQLGHSWSTPIWTSWQPDTGENAISHQSSSFYEHQQQRQQQQRSSSGSTGPLGPQHAGWGGRERHFGLPRSKTVEGAPQGAHTLSPPYNSRYPKIARKAAAASADKNQQPAASHRPLHQPQQEQARLQGYGWHEEEAQLRQEQQQQPRQRHQQELLLPLHRTQQVGAAGWPESSSDSSLSGIERSLLKLVEESPGNPCGVCTPQSTPNEKQQQHQIQQQLVQYSSAKDFGAAICEAAAVAAAFKGSRAGSEEEEPYGDPHSVEASTAPEMPHNACDRAQEGGDPPVCISSTNGLLEAFCNCARQLQRFQGPQRATVTERLPTASLCWCRHAGPDKQTGDVKTNISASKKTQREHEHQCTQQQQQQQQQQEQLPSHSGLQFLWQHPASVLASTVQNTAANDLAFLPLCCDGAANGI